MANTKIFITYNNKEPQEQTLAIRMHTIGAVNDFTMYLPDRFDSETEISDETKRRINQSDYVVLFLLTPTISKAVKQEIDYAFSKFKDKSKIIVIYNANRLVSGKKNAKSNYTAFYYSPLQEKMDSIIQRIISEIFKKENEEKKSSNAFITLLGIGLGLAALAIFSNDKD